MIIPRVRPDPETRLDIEAAIEGLTDKQREALLLWLEGYTQEEIGERLGITHQAVSRLTERAVERIQESLN